MTNSETLELSVEEFSEKHPALNPLLLVEHARVVLARYHRSPASFRVHYDEHEHNAAVSFRDPDHRSLATLEQEDFVEKGAIVMAGLALNSLAGKQITRVVRRGTKVDYFVGEAPDDFRWILEVGGISQGNLAAKRREKREQLKQSIYRTPPHNKDGFVSTTRFAQPAATALDSVVVT
jgi:hypothetical protein